jgi:hypothetical protein
MLKDGERCKAAPVLADTGICGVFPTILTAKIECPRGHLDSRNRFPDAWKNDRKNVENRTKIQPSFSASRATGSYALYTTGLVGRSGRD